MANEIKAGKAFVEITAKDNALSRVLAGVQKKLAAFGAGLRTMGRRMFVAGAAITAPLVAASKVFADSGSQLWDMSKRTGASVESLSELKYAADQSGASLAEVGGALKFMNKNLAEAAKGGAEANEALAMLGLDVAKLAEMNTDQRFEAIAAALASVQDPALKTALAMKLFGRAGDTLIPMLEELNQLRAEARRKGLIFSEDEARQADVLGDAISTATASVKRAVVSIGSALAPTLTRVAEIIADVAKRVSEWVKQNQGLVTMVLYAAAGAMAAGVAITTLGFAVGGVAKVFGLLAVAVKAAFVALAGLKAITLAIATPVGAVLAVVAAMVGYLVVASGAGGKALAWLGQQFAGLSETVRTTMGGIIDALTAGDIGLAAQILWAGVKLATAQGVGAIQTVWTGFKNWLMGTWTTIWSGASVIGEEMWSMIRRAWINGVAFIKTMWAGVVGMFKQAQLAATQAFTEVFVRRDAAEAGEAARKRALDQGKSSQEAGAIGEAARKKYLDEGMKYAADQDARARARIEAERKAQLAATDADARASLDAEAKRHEAAMVNIAAQAKAQDDARKAATEGDKTAAEQELARLQGELAALRAKAAAKAGAAGTGTGPGDMPKAPELPSGANLQSLMSGLAPRGLFNIKGLQSLQGDGTNFAKETAKNTKKSADKLQQIETVLLDSRPVFT